MRKLGLCVLATAITLGVCAAPAVADDTECVGVLSGTHDNVVVPPGANCTLSGAIVKGNVTALRSSSLGTNLSQIGGNIEAHRPRFVGSFGDTIGGNFSVTGPTGDPGFIFPPFNVTVFVCASSLPGGNIVVKRSMNGTVAVGSLLPVCPGNNVGQGNIQVENNFIPPGEALQVARNTVGGNVQVFKNRGPGQKDVAENVVREAIQCRGNDQPFIGGPNVAAEAEGQCFLGP